MEQRGNLQFSQEKIIIDFDCCLKEARSLCPCFAVDLTGDEVFEKRNRSCMLFSRSSFTCHSDTKWAEQFNAVTSFIDCSTIYGSDDAKALLLRGGHDRRKDGKLWTSERLRDFKVPTRSDLSEY